MKKPLVFIIILNWNGIKDTIKCIESVFKNDYPNYKVVVVDNGSHDDSVKILQEKYPKLPLIINKENLGYAEGNNVGMRYALKSKPAYVLFLNNDTVVDKHWLSRLVSHAESDQKIGIVGPKIYYAAKPHLLWFAGGKIDYDNGPFLHIDQGKPDSKTNNEAKGVDYITGCSLLIKEELLNKIGGFDKKYFAYVEDIDLNLRAKNHGYESHIVPSSKIWHNVSASSGGEVNTLKEFYKARNLIFFFRKNFEGRTRTVLLYKALNLKFREISMRIRYYNLSIPLAILRGLYHGFRE